MAAIVVVDFEAGESTPQMRKGRDVAPTAVGAEIESVLWKKLVDVAQEEEITDNLRITTRV